MNYINYNILCTQFFENASTYLGYKLTFRNAKMCYDIVGTRHAVDIHNTNHTKSHLFKMLTVVKSIICKHGNIWLVNPGLAWLPNSLGFSQFQKNLLARSVVVWTSSWTPGFFTNSIPFSLVRNAVPYPTMLFYPNHTSNSQRLADGSNTGILQSGISDSNSSRKAYSYSISANEKTRNSNEFFMKIIVALARNCLLIKRSNFFKNDK